jgi:hypothetical protein
MAIAHPAHRRAWALVAAFLAVVGAALAMTYGRQIVSYVTHIRGSPTNTTALVAFPPGDQPVLRLAVVGDVGDGGGRAATTAEAIARAAGATPYDALLLLGDNVYPDGDPALLGDRVFDPFEPVLSQGTELLAILGNHDVMRGEDAGIIAGLGMRGRWWAERWDDVLLVGLDSTRTADPDQRLWLEATLRASDARWKIAAVHHPPYSAGYQGSSLDVRETFGPLFERYGVQLVLSGHEHDYQRSVPIDGVTYVVSGAAADTRRTGTEDFTVRALSWHHFVEIAVLHDRVVVRAVNQKLRVFDQFELR